MYLHWYAMITCRVNFSDPTYTFWVKSGNPGKGKEKKDNKSRDKKGPNLELVVQVYGSEGKSQVVPLTSKKASLYQPGKTDKFDVSSDYSFYRFM